MQRDRRRQSAVESWLLEHVGLVLMGPIMTDCFGFYQSASLSLSLSGFPRNPLRWNRYRPNWGFTITYTVCSIHTGYTSHSSSRSQKVLGSLGWQIGTSSNTCFINQADLCLPVLPIKPLLQILRDFFFFHTWVVSYITGNTWTYTVVSLPDSNIYVPSVVTLQAVDAEKCCKPVFTWAQTACVRWDYKALGGSSTCHNSLGWQANKWQRTKHTG